MHLIEGPHSFGRSLKLNIGSFQIPLNIQLTCTVNYYVCDNSA